MMITSFFHFQYFDNFLNNLLLMYILYEEEVKGDLLYDPAARRKKIAALKVVFLNKYCIVL